jgi:hypothetical protein
MFKVLINKQLDQPCYFTQVVVVETLAEAELMALKLAIQHFKTNSLVLVYRDNLSYDVFEVGEPIGQIQIKSVG